jgi:AAA ATPase domain
MGSVGFVGRERELSSLRGALGGDTRLLLVAGDAGVGKTRLVGEGMRRAAADGMVSVLGGLPLAGELPLLRVAEAPRRDTAPCRGT